MVFISWRTSRWDQPWLAPTKGYDMIVVRFDGLSYGDKDIAQPRAVFVKPLERTVFHDPNLHGFRPSDLTYDECKRPTPSAWVGMIGSVQPKLRNEALNKISREVDVEIRKTGLKVGWKMALVTRDGSVIYPE